MLRLFPEARRIAADRDRAQGERDSMALKMRATSAKMGIMEEEARELRRGQDRLKQELAGAKQELGGAKQELEGLKQELVASKQELVGQTAEGARLTERLQASLAAGGAVTKERDRLAAERDALLKATRTGPGK
jgi:uncharacterized protein (DUF3084 family)